MIRGTSDFRQEFLPVAAIVMLLLAGCAGGGDENGAYSDGGRPTDRILVAHRGASAYAPEHTLPAYRLAIEQGADYIEPDLQITRDGILIALHDETLDRTTNVADVYPDRFTEEMVDGETVRRWYARDFTLDEIRVLDAGSWFGAEFRESHVPTLDEVITVAREAGVGIFPETKVPEVYGSLGFDMEELVVEALERHGLHGPDGVPGTPVVLQSFSAESLRILREEQGVRVPLIFLVGAPDRERRLTDDGLAQVATFADGIGPTKSLVLDDPSVVDRAHELGLMVIPWTFRSARPGDFESGSAEMAHYLYELGVDGLFTDNPDHFPQPDDAGSS